MFILLFFVQQEEAQRLEKERMKKLTLEINERQEEEDLNEAIAQVSLLVIHFWPRLAWRRGPRIKYSGHLCLSDFEQVVDIDDVKNRV